MFIHNLKYSLKALFRNKLLIFWTFAFPIILGTLFNMAFSNIENSEKLDIINIAIIKNEDFEKNEILKKSLEELSDEKRLFNIKYTSSEEAKGLLEKKEIVGFLKLEENEPIITFQENGINETIFKYVVEEVFQTSDLIKNLSEIEIKKEMMAGNFNINYEKVYNKISEIINENDIKINNISNKNLSYTMIEFYTLIAMTCLYGGMLSLVTINQTLANMSNKGQRITVSPSKKSTIILSSLLASYIAQVIGLAILFVYTIFVLKVDYGDNFPLIMLLSIIGSLTGLSLGTFVGTAFRTNENTKTGILISFTMLGCFFSGMMGITMKYIIDKNIPIINKLNPANMITDGFYSLYYYDTLDRYWANIISLLIFAGILIIISFLNLRRQKYDSI